MTSKFHRALWPSIRKEDDYTNEYYPLIESKFLAQQHIADGQLLMTPINISIKRWAAWTPGIDTEDDWQQWAQGNKYPLETQDSPQPDIPPMLRRRLSALGKAALSVANKLLEPSQPMPTIFCSRHGKVQRTVALLQALANQEPLSPTHFSLSVHNALGGILSIVRKDSSNVTALAVRQGELGIAFMEAAAIAQEHSSREALCVIYDEPVPTIYGESSLLPIRPYAAAFLISTDVSNSNNSYFSLSIASQLAQADVDNIPQALQFIKLILRPQLRELNLAGGRHSWRLSKHD